MLTYRVLPRRSTRCTCHILAKNAEGTIAQCLDSAVRPRVFSNILVILDTKSTDATAKIVQSYARRHRNITVLPYQWASPADFSAARNFAVSRSYTPYAFWLDADEILTKPQQIASMLSRQVGQAFFIWVISPTAGGGFHNMFQPRLFPIVQGVYFQCPVFERLDWSLEARGIVIEKTSAEPIHHPGYADPRLLSLKNDRNRLILSHYLSTHHWARTPQWEHIKEQFDKLM